MRGPPNLKILECQMGSIKDTTYILQALTSRTWPIHDQLHPFIMAISIIIRCLYRKILLEFHGRIFGNFLSDMKKKQTNQMCHNTLHQHLANVQANLLLSITYYPSNGLHQHLAKYGRMRVMKLIFRFRTKRYLFVFYFNTLKRVINFL